MVAATTVFYLYHPCPAFHPFLVPVKSCARCILPLHNYTPTHREGAILQSPCPSVSPSVHSHFRNRYLSFYWKKWFYIWYMALAWWLVPCLHPIYHPAHQITWNKINYKYLSILIREKEIYNVGSMHMK
jgi:hypothetical protein